LILPERVPICGAPCIDLTLLRLQVQPPDVGEEIHKGVPTLGLPELMAISGTSRFDISSRRPNGSEKGIVGERGRLTILYGGIHLPGLCSILYMECSQPGDDGARSISGYIHNDRVHRLAYHSQILCMGLLVPEVMPGACVKPIECGGGPDQ
jgi:hypothetical protein